MLTNKLILRASLLCLIVTLGSAGAAFAQVSADWIEAFPPHRVVSNIYYVGSKGLRRT